MIQTKLFLSLSNIPFRRLMEQFNKHLIAEFYLIFLFLSFNFLCLIFERWNQNTFSNSHRSHRLAMKMSESRPCWFLIYLICKRFISRFYLDVNGLFLNLITILMEMHKIFEINRLFTEIAFLPKFRAACFVLDANYVRSCFGFVTNCVQSSTKCVFIQMHRMWLFVCVSVCVQTDSLSIFFLS